MEGFKFKVGDNVLVEYANDKTKVGRVESVYTWGQDSGTFINYPKYKVSIKGNKRLKTCYEFELRPCS